MPQFLLGYTFAHGRYPLRKIYELYSRRYPRFSKYVQVFSWILVGCSALALGPGCATPYLKGMTPAGERVYLGPDTLRETEAYQSFLRSAKSEVDKQNYLFQRLKDAKELEYYHDGSWYNWLETYRGGMWLIRNRYEKGQDTRTFLRKYVWRSESGKLHLVRYPNGSIQIGYFVLMNELDLLEETVRKDSGAINASS